jgi:adenylate cyclase
VETGRLLYSFENYILDTDRRELRREARLIDLEPQVFDLLEYLIRHRDRVVSRDDLIASIWGGRIVSESALSTRINAVRGALDDTGVEQRLIKTFRRKGVRFVGAVSEEQHPTGAKGAELSAQQTGPELTPPDRPSIAVLPFTNLGGDMEQEYFADGMVEDIITELSRIRSLFVIARNSSFAYRGKLLDIKQIGRELGCAYLVEGGLRKVGDRVRVTAQLIDTQTAAHVWADRYDRSLSDIFVVQDEIVRAVVASIQTHVMIHVSPASGPRGRPDIPTWELVKKAWKELYQLSRAGVTRSIEIARLAVAHDPQAAAGYQVLASGLFHMVYMGFAPDASPIRDEALSAAHRALELEPKDELSQWAFAIIVGYLSDDTARACSALRQAIELNPNFSLGYGSLGTILAFAGQLDDSIANNLMAIRLNPKDPSLFFRYSGLAIAYHAKSDFVACREWAERSISRKPDWWLGYALLASSCAYLGDMVGARAAVDGLKLVLPDARIGSIPLFHFNSSKALAQVKEGLRRAGLAD